MGENLNTLEQFHADAKAAKDAEAKERDLLRTATMFVNGYRSSLKSELDNILGRLEREIKRDAKIHKLTAQFKDNKEMAKNMALEVIEHRYAGTEMSIIEMRKILGEC